MMDRQTRVGLVICVCLVLATGGCLSLADDSIEDDVRERLDEAEPPETVAGEQRISAVLENETIEVTQAVWYRADGSSRVEVDDGEAGPTITVNDGDRIWTYRPDENAVQFTNVTERTGNQLRQLYNSTREIITRLDVTDASEGTVGERDAYHLVLEPREDEESVDISVLDALTRPFSSVGDGESDGGALVGPEPDRAELWLDTESLFPLRTVIESDDSTIETRFRNVSFDPDVPEGHFEFEPPANATVEEITLPDVTEYDTVADADDATSFPVEEPGSLPDGFDLVRAVVTSDDESGETTATLRYGSSDGGFLSVQIRDGTFEQQLSGEQVDLNGKTGTYVTDDVIDSHVLYWSCDGIEYVVTGGQGLDREDVTAVGSSIECG